MLHSPATHRPPNSRVAAAHCCAAAPSEPGVRRFDAPGSSKPSVKIRCRSRRTSSSTARQSTASQSTTSPSGPFTSTVSNLPIGSSVSVHLFFTGSPDPRQLPFGPGNTPVSDQLCGIPPAEVPATRFPVSCRRFGCRPSLLGSSCARWRVAPSSRSAHRRRSAGPQRGCRVAHEQDPTGQGALLIPGTVVRSGPATILRPAPAALPRPVPIPRWNIPSAGVTFTRRHQGFTHVRPSPQDDRMPPRSRETSPLPAGLLLACRPRMEREPLRLLPRASHPAVTRDARRGGDRPSRTDPSTTPSTSVEPQRRLPLSLMHPHFAPSHMLPQVPLPGAHRPPPVAAPVSRDR